MWDGAMDECDVCQCSRMIKRGFKLSRPNCDSFGDDGSYDKENVPQLSPMKSNETEISFYDTGSPASSPSHCSRHFKRRPLEDHDPNSLDSGYNTSFDAKFYKSSSLSSMDDAFWSITGVTPLEDNDNALPTDFNKLITQPISMLEKASPVKRVKLQRPLSLPLAKREETVVFTVEEEEIRAFKRPDAPTDLTSPFSIKRVKLLHETQRRPPLMRSISENPEEIINLAIDRSESEPNLIGDFSKTFCLPLIRGLHPDLKSISPTTLAALMKGCFTQTVASFKVIDCRYPYEYEGGHISGAINIYTKEQCMKLLDVENTPSSSPDKRHILVFHCEFSSKRGPSLSKFLRNMDRKQNETAYPALNYPEVYLLDGGYKSFYEQFSELCEPIAYKPMLHPEHKDDLKLFRAKSKSSEDEGKRTLQKKIRRITINDSL